MGSMFSSPSKAGNAVASGENSQIQAGVNQLENYTNQQEQNLRSAIGGLGPNPYLSAGPTVAKAQPTTSPGYTASFGGGNPPVVSGAPPPANPFTAASSAAVRRPQ